MIDIFIEKYKVQATGVDAGHNYIVTQLAYEGVNRKLVILCADKSEELSLNEKKPIKVKGNIEDSGIEHDLIMANARVVIT